jgi:hypothetical protein
LLYPDKIPPNNSKLLPPLNVIPRLGLHPNVVTVRARIDDFVTKLWPKIEEFFNTPRLAHWSPPKSASEDAQKFYQALAIPLVNDKPSLLLHELLEHSSPNGEMLFNSGKHK